MIVVGLTGSIGMGKSTVAEYLRRRGTPVLDADKLVHDLYRGDAVPLIEAVFPGTTRDGVVNRELLGKAVLGAKSELEKLEAIIHPLVRDAEWAFLDKQQTLGSELAVLEIPLLFETGAADLFDAIIVVSAPAAVQRERVLARPGMTAEKLDSIAARQWTDAQKTAKADFVVDTGLPFEDTAAQIDVALDAIKRLQPLAYQRWAALHNSETYHGHNARTRS